LIRVFGGLSFGAALLAAGLSPIAAIAGEIPVSAKERASLEIRLLQTELMVSALACQARDSYNTFVTRFQSELVDSGKNLKSLFSRVHGKDGTTRLNSFVTEVANDASMKSLQMGDQFCNETAQTFQALLSGKTSLEASRGRFRCTPIASFAGCMIEAGGEHVAVQDAVSR
jgi:hypothetical protein